MGYRIWRDQSGVPARVRYPERSDLFYWHCSHIDHRQSSRNSVRSGFGAWIRRSISNRDPGAAEPWQRRLARDCNYRWRAIAYRRRANRTTVELITMRILTLILTTSLLANAQG